MQREVKEEFLCEWSNFFQSNGLTSTANQTFIKIWLIS